MSKRLILILIVIVLISLNWFRLVAAQDLESLSGMSEAEKKELLSKYAGGVVPSARTGDFQTPAIYDSSVNVAVPVDETRRPTASERTGPLGFEDLAPFGTELFSGPREVNPPNDIASSPDYILGPGDNLIISLWGQVERELVLTIDREGKMFVPKVGEMVVWGKTLGEFRAQLRKRFETIYSEFGLSVSLGKIRSIRVYLTGEVDRPGAYTVSSLTSLYNALFLAGGPSENGSMRDIKLMRNGKPVAEVDLYKFLLEGDNSSDVRLQSGDAIFVPVAGPRVAIKGKIRRPAIYEVKDGQTALNLLALAGGSEPDAYLDRVMLERIAGRDEWQVRDLQLNVSKPDSVDNLELNDGDRLTVFSVFEAKRNMVAVYGLVQHPGYYERNETTHISDLVERAKLQPYDVYVKRANLFRRHADWSTEVIAVDLEHVGQDPLRDILLQDGDSLHVYSISDVTRNRMVFIDGKVKRPGEYPLYDSMTVEDLIFLAGSFTRGAFTLRAEIARYDKRGVVTLQDYDLGKRDSSPLTLQDNDRVYIRQIPLWQLHRTVTLEGELLFPGEYVLAGQDETLYDLIVRSGGLSNMAFPQGTILERKSIGDKLEALQIPSLLKKSNPMVQDSLGNFTRTLLLDYDAQSMNRIVLDMELLLATKGEFGNVVLQPGDRIHVPARPSGISVLGAVGANGTLGFVEGKKVKDYVKRAGDFTDAADKKGLRLIKANGEVFSGGGTPGQRVDIGDVIVVPTKVKQQRNLGRTVTNVLTTTTGVLTTILLIDRL